MLETPAFLGAPLPPSQPALVLSPTAKLGYVQSHPPAPAEPLGITLDTIDFTDAQDGGSLKLYVRVTGAIPVVIRYVFIPHHVDEQTVALCFDGTLIEARKFLGIVEVASAVAYTHVNGSDWYAKRHIDMDKYKDYRAVRCLAGKAPCTPEEKARFTAIRLEMAKSPGYMAARLDANNPDHMAFVPTRPARDPWDMFYLVRHPSDNHIALGSEAPHPRQKYCHLRQIMGTLIDKAREPRRSTHKSPDGTVASCMWRPATRPPRVVMNEPASWFRGNPAAPTRLVEKECPVCLEDKLVDPYISPCGHVACRACWITLSRTSGVCFACRADIALADYNKFLSANLA